MTSRHLLALVLELGKISESEASRKMGVEPGRIREWVDELQAEGFIGSGDTDIGDITLKVTPEGLKKLKKIESDWIEQEGADAEKEAKAEARRKGKPKPRLKLGLKAVFNVVFNAVKAIRRSWVDLVILGAILASLYLLKQFVESPNAEALSFFFVSLLLSFTLMLYNRYRKSLKTAKFIGFMEWFFQLVKSNSRYIASLLVLVLMIYVVGMFMLKPHQRNMYLMAIILTASTGLLIYYPKRSILGVLKFYVGIILLAYGLLLIVDGVSLTGTFFESKVRLLDLGIGIAFLVLVHLNEGWIGIRGKWALKD